MVTSARAELEARLQQVVQLLRKGASGEAEALAARARQTFPVAAELARLHGLALLQLGRRREALIALHRAAELAPGNVEVQLDLADVALGDGRPESAIERLQVVLGRMPGQPVVLQALGVALMVAARCEEARDVFLEASHAAPQHAGLRLNLAEAELELGQLSQALIHVREALQRAPQLAPAHALLGHVLRAQGQFAAAADAWLEAERLAPDEPRHPFQAARMLEEAGRIGDAAVAYARALQRAPHSGAALSRLAFARRRLADWSQQPELTTQLRDGVTAGRHGIVPFALLVEPFDRTLQLRAATTFAQSIDRHMAPLRRQLAFTRTRPAPDAAIRVGLISDGFGEHPTGRTVLALVEALAAAGGLALHLFATSADDRSPTRRRLAAAAPLRALDTLPPAQAARAIHAQDIEVLFDLTGYGTHTHADLLALRPAPLQVAWLAYPGTTGAPWIDYVLADTIVLPASHRADYSEKVLRLPRCFLPVDPAPVSAPTPARSECGLPPRGVVFACFNATSKLTPATFACFMQILHEVPGSVLWLRSGPDGADARLRAEAAARGIAPERLVFLPTLPHAQYLACYALVDLVLDTQPCSARTTAADALRAGCPLLTCAGTTFASRVAASLLHHAHLPELVAEDADAFVALAVRLGRDRSALAALRAQFSRLPAQSPVFDVAGFAADFRRVAQTLGTRHRIGRPPIDLDF